MALKMYECHISLGQEPNFTCWSSAEKDRYCASHPLQTKGSAFEDVNVLPVLKVFQAQ